MKKNISILLSIISIWLFTGCGQQAQPPLYIWNGYTSSSLNYGEHIGDSKIRKSYMNQLQTIITDSNTKHKRVAPGIYAEYGQILYNTGKKELARKYFLLEEKTYPESTKFIDTVMTKLYGETK